MRLVQKYLALCVLLMLAASSAWSMQESESIVAHAKGDGVLKFGDQEYKISSVVVKLFADGKAEISLISEFTIFITGSWSRRESAPKVIDIKITGGATGGGVEASGELLLRGDQKKSIESIALQGMSKTTKRDVSLNFRATE